MSMPPWGDDLLNTSAQAPIPDSVNTSLDDVILWLAKFDASSDQLAQQAERQFGSSSEATSELLHRIDRWVLVQPVRPDRVFGRKALIAKDLDTIRLRFKRLSRLFHPDRALAEEVWLNERMAVLNEVYRSAQEVCASDGEYQVPRFDQSRSRPVKYSSQEVYTQAEQEWDQQWASSYSSLLRFLQRFDTKTMVRIGSAVLVIVVVSTALSLMLEPKPAPQPSPNVEQQTRVAASFLQEQQEQQDSVSDMLDDLLAQTSTRSMRTPPAQVAHEPATQDTFDERVSRTIDLYDEEQQRHLSTNSSMQASTAAIGGELGPSVNNSLSPSTAQAKDAQAMQSSGNETLKPRLRTNSAIEVASQQKGERLSADQAQDSSSVLPIPGQVKELLRSLEASFAARSASSFGGYFTPDGSYFGEQGQRNIVAGRKQFFGGVGEAPKLGFDIYGFRELRGGYVLLGDQRVTFMVSAQNMYLCQPFNMLIKSLPGNRLVVANIQEIRHAATRC